MRYISKINLIVLISMFIAALFFLAFGFVSYDKANKADDVLSNDYIRSFIDYNNIVAQKNDDFKISGNFKIGEEVVNYDSNMWKLIYLNNKPFLYIEEEGLKKELSYKKNENLDDEVYLVITVNGSDQYAKVFDSEEYNRIWLETSENKSSGMKLVTVGFILFFISIYRLIGFVSKKPACDCQLGPPLQ